MKLTESYMKSEKKQQEKYSYKNKHQMHDKSDKGKQKRNYTLRTIKCEDWKERLKQRIS